jgi:hypothetical protein
VLGTRNLTWAMFDHLPLLGFLNPYDQSLPILVVISILISFITLHRYQSIIQIISSNSHPTSHQYATSLHQPSDGSTCLPPYSPGSPFSSYLPCSPLCYRQRPIAFQSQISRPCHSSWRDCSADAKLARAWSVAWSYGRGVCRGAPEEAKEDFDVLVEHGEAGADETGVGFDHRPICCWDGANCYVVLDLLHGNADLNTYMLSLFLCLMMPRVVIR